MYYFKLADLQLDVIFKSKVITVKSDINLGEKK